YQRFPSLLERTVKIELELYWARVGGQDVVSLVKELGDRLVAIHVKDGIKPPSNPFAPGSPKFSSKTLDQRHAGEGEVPTVEAMKAATNVKYAVIEYDNAPGDVFEDVENSYRFLIDGGLAA